MPESFPYSIQYEPAAPVAEVTIKVHGETKLLALIDSGADATMIPIAALRAVNARFIEKHRVVPVFGRTYSVDLYRINVQMAGYEIPAIEAVALADGDEAIIGRDVLNHLIITLDGIGGLTEIT